LLYEYIYSVLLLIIFYISVLFHTQFTTSNVAKTIHILYRQGASVHDIVEAYAHAFEIRLLLLACHNCPPTPQLGGIYVGQAETEAGTDSAAGSSYEYRLNKFYIDGGRRALDLPGTAK
jgi:hypothetical protein